MKRKATNLTDYQKRVHEFSVGDRVIPFGSGPEMAGSVIEVHYGIGMVDVQFATGSIRMPVEDVQILADDGSIITPEWENQSVPGTDVYQAPPVSKTALYWADRDRRYRANKGECDSKIFTCPKCRCEEGLPIPLKKAIYKRREGASEHLLGCPKCLFLIKKEDIMRKLEEM
tara:strand:- start:531 stop:1046 length:516 start_codon:yes stop_codon:yes gene_type:complete